MNRSGSRTWEPNPVVTLKTRTVTARFTAAEIPVDQRAPVIAAYRTRPENRSTAASRNCPTPLIAVFRLTPYEKLLMVKRLSAWTRG